MVQFGETEENEMGVQKDRGHSGKIVEDREQRSTLHSVLLSIRRDRAERYVWESSGLGQQEAPGSCGDFEEGRVVL